MSTMARSTRRRSNPVVTGEVVARWRDDPQVVRLTRQVIRIHTETTRKLVEAIVEIGGRLSEIRTRLAHGEWLTWLDDEEIPIQRRTVSNYITLFEWSQHAKRQFNRFAHLGPAKLYILAAGDADQVKALKVRDKVPIPGTGTRKTIGDMTTGELKKVVGGFATPPTRRPPIGQLVQAAVFGIAGIEADTDALEQRADEVPAGTGPQIAAKLRALAVRYEAMG
jgi:hypothetical protein